MSQMLIRIDFSNFAPHNKELSKEAKNVQKKQKKSFFLQQSWKEDLI